MAASAPRSIPLSCALMEFQERGHSLQIAQHEAAANLRLTAMNARRRANGLRYAMLSSLNSYHGLSVADVLKLFGAKPSSSPSGSTPASAAQSASAAVSATSANDPANTIKAILAQAQITQVRTNIPEGGSATSIAVTRAYAAATETSGGESSSVVVEKTAYAVRLGSANPFPDAGVTKGVRGTGQALGVDYSIGYSLTTAPSTSSADEKAGRTDYFEINFTLGDDSIAIGFTVDGLGEATANEGYWGYSFGPRGQDAVLQMGVAADGGNVSFDLNLTGLDAAQAHRGQAAFKAATSSPDETGLQYEGSGFQFDRNFAPGFDADLSAWGGYN